MKISNRVYKKIILGSSTMLGLVVALPVFAVMMTGSASITKSAGDGTVVTTQSASPVIATFQGSPCEFNTSLPSGNMMYGSNPCNNFFQAGRTGFQEYGHKSQWYELMFILTVMMVWAVLLLLIGVLWKQLKKHKSN